VVSVEVGGPQESPEGRAEMRSERDTGAMVANYAGNVVKGLSVDIEAIRNFGEILIVEV